MRLITAIIKPEMLERLATALRRAGVSGITVDEVQGFGRETLGSDWDKTGYLTKKVKVEAALNDEVVDEIVSLIHNTVYTGTEGDGIIFVTNLQAVVRISSGERDSSSLT